VQEIFAYGLHAIPKDAFQLFQGTVEVTPTPKVIQRAMGGLSPSSNMQEKTPQIQHLFI